MEKNNSQKSPNNSNKINPFNVEDLLMEHKFFGIIVNKIKAISSEKIKTRILEFVNILNSSNVDFLGLKRLVFEGLPDEVPSLRSLAWKMILNYLPFNMNEWENFIDSKRTEYTENKEKIITKLELDKQKYANNLKENNYKIGQNSSNKPQNASISKKINLKHKFLKTNSANNYLLLGNSDQNRDTKKLKNNIKNENIEILDCEQTASTVSCISNMMINKINLKESKNQNDLNPLDNLNINNTNSKNKGTVKKVNLIKKKNTFDHPLNQTKNSKWKNYFDDIDLFEEIDKDVRRTRTHMNFFFMPAKSNKHLNTIKNEEISDHADKKRNEPSFFQDAKNKAAFDTNADLMCRILFIYAKKYPEVRYVQGMNEILAPILYCFSHDQNPYFYLNVEADAYNCFENFMNEIKDIFIRSKDNTETGIQTRLKNLFNMLKVFDRDLFTHLQNENVELQYFAFRWYTLFFTQEFEMPDILRLWDSLLSEDEKFDFINMICIAIIKMKRQEILQNDFAGIMLTIQNFETIEVENIIKYGLELRKEINKCQI